MTSEQAHKIYDILVFCGAQELHRTYFIMNMFDKDRRPTEWRFQGYLGFGGKFYPDEMRVSCYPEDETPYRRAMIDAANMLLQEEPIGFWCSENGK